jgi:hypothetical protein
MCGFAVRSTMNTGQMMRRQFSFFILIAVLSVGVASCVDEPAEQDSGGTTHLGLDESISCPAGEVGWRFPKTPLDPNSEEYARRAGESATVEITERFAVDVQSATCAGGASDEVNLLRNECAGSVTCRYSPSCSGAFAVTYTCGAGDTDDAGSQKTYTAQTSGGAVELACSQPAEEAVEVETRTACVPRQCHGRARRNLDMECVENPSAFEVAMAGGFRDIDGLSRPHIYAKYAAQSRRNYNVLTGEPLDANANKFLSPRVFGLFGDNVEIYPDMPYTVALPMLFWFGLVPDESSVTAWIDDHYKHKQTGAIERGFRCVAFKGDVDPSNGEPANGHRDNVVVSARFEGAFSKSCIDGGRVSEDNAAKKLGLSVTEFRQDYEHQSSQLHASYDMEGRTVWHKTDTLASAYGLESLAYHDPECSPNPQDFYYDADKGTYDLISYYAQREFATPVEIYFVRPEVDRQATIIPGEIKARSSLTIRTKSKFSTSLPVDLSWSVANLHQQNIYNPWAEGVDVGGAWETGKSLPDANYAPTNVRASVFVYPWGQTDDTSRLYGFKIGTIPLEGPNPEGTTQSANLPINENIKRYFTRSSSDAYVEYDSRLFQLFYCIESDQDPQRPGNAFKTRQGMEYYNCPNRDFCVRNYEQNYTITDYLPDTSDAQYYKTYNSLVLDTNDDANNAHSPFTEPGEAKRVMRGCRASPQPLRVNIDRFTTPLEPIASAGFAGATKTSESGNGKMSSANDNDTEINCTGQAKKNCKQVDNGGNRTDGDNGRSMFSLNSELDRNPGDKATAGMTGEMLGFQLVDPTDPVSDFVSYPADSSSASSTPLTITLTPNWDGIKAALDQSTTGSPVEWDTGRYGGQMGLGVGWGFKSRFQIGPVPVLVTFTFTVGASVVVEAQFQFAPTDEQKYPCIGTQSCVVKVSEPAGFREAAQTCTVQGGRLAELSSQAEATAVDANRGGEDVWLGAQLAYRHAKPACATNYVASECDSSSQTEYRWLSNSRAFAQGAARTPPGYNSTHVFNALETGLVTRYPHDSAVVYKANGSLESADVGVQKPYLCVFEPAADEDFLRWQLALKMGAAAGFNLTGCVPSDNPGFCLGAGFNVVAFSIGPVYENIYHWLYRAGEDSPFAKRGNTNISVPWALKLFEGAVTASVNFLWFSVKWTIIAFDGITAAEGKLYDADTPVFEDLE